MLKFSPPALAAMALLIAGLAGGLYWAIYHAGAESVRSEVDLERARADADQAGVNAEIAKDGADAAGRFGQRHVMLIEEAAHGRRDIERFDAEPAPGAVGADALVDPALARLVVCRIERVRGLAASPFCGGDGADRLEPQSAHEPVPARNPARS